MAPGTSVPWMPPPAPKSPGTALSFERKPPAAAPPPGSNVPRKGSRLCAVPRMSAEDTAESVTRSPAKPVNRLRWLASRQTRKIPGSPAYQSKGARPVGTCCTASSKPDPAKIDLISRSSLTPRITNSGSSTGSNPFSMSAAIPASHASAMSGYGETSPSSQLFTAKYTTGGMAISSTTITGVCQRHQ